MVNFILTPNTDWAAFQMEDCALIVLQTVDCPEQIRTHDHPKYKKAEAAMLEMLDLNYFFTAET